MMRRSSSENSSALGEEGAEHTNALKSIRLQRNQPRAAYQSAASVPSLGTYNTANLSHAGAEAVDIYTKRALQVLVLSENEIITVQERIANEVSRKNKILQKVWNKMSGSEKLLMKQHGFRRWQCKLYFCARRTFSTDFVIFYFHSHFADNVGKLRDNQQHIAAIKMQSLARKYLCRVHYKFSL